MFDDNSNDLSVTAPYVDPCNIDKYDILGYPYGGYGRFFQSPHAPACITRVKNDYATVYQAPWRFLLDMITRDIDAWSVPALPGRGADVGGAFRPVGRSTVSPHLP